MKAPNQNKDNSGTYEKSRRAAVEDLREGLVLIDTEGWTHRLRNPTKGVTNCWDAGQAVVFGREARCYFIDEKQLNTVKVA